MSIFRKASRFFLKKPLVSKKSLRQKRKICIALLLPYLFFTSFIKIDVNATNPKVSIIIPVYNADKTIDRCLQSALRQSLRDIEIICVNDGSQDNSRTALEKYSKEDTRIKVINQRNGGASSARNAGLNAATGDYIGFIDSDDYVNDNTFEVAYNVAIKNQADIVTFGAWCTEVETGREWYWGPSKTYYFKKNGASSLLDPDGYYSVIWNKLFRRDLIETNRIRFRTDMRNKEDTVFVLDLVPYIKNAVSLHESFYHQFRSAQGLVKTAKAALLLQATRIQAEHFARAWKRPELQTFRFLAEINFHQWLDWATKQYLPSIGASAEAIRSLETYCRTLMND